MDLLDLVPLDDVPAGRQQPTANLVGLPPAQPDVRDKAVGAIYEAARLGNTSWRDAVDRAFTYDVEAQLGEMELEFAGNLKEVLRRVRAGGFADPQAVLNRVERLKRLRDPLEIAREAGDLKLEIAYATAPTEQMGVQRVVEAIIDERYAAIDAYVDARAHDVANMLLEEAGLPPVDTRYEGMPLYDPVALFEEYGADRRNADRRDIAAGIIAGGQARQPPPQPARRPAASDVARTPGVRRAARRGAGVVERMRRATVEALPAGDASSDSLGQKIAEKSQWMVAGVVRAAWGSLPRANLDRAMAYLQVFLLSLAPLLVFVFFIVALAPVIAGAGTRSTRAGQALAETSEVLEEIMVDAARYNGLSTELVPTIRSTYAEDARRALRANPQLVKDGFERMAVQLVTDVEWGQTTDRDPAWLQEDINSIYAPAIGDTLAADRIPLVQAAVQTARLLEGEDSRRGLALAQGQDMTADEVDELIERFVRRPLSVERAMNVPSAELVRATEDLGRTLVRLARLAGERLQSPALQLNEVRRAFAERTGTDMSLTLDLEGILQWNVFSMLSTVGRVAVAGFTSNLAFVHSHFLLYGSVAGLAVSRTMLAPLFASLARHEGGIRGGTPSGWVTAGAVRGVDAGMAGFVWAGVLGLAYTGWSAVAAQLDMLSAGVVTSGLSIAAGTALAALPTIIASSRLTGTAFPDQSPRQLLSFIWLNPLKFGLPAVYNSVFFSMTAAMFLTWASTFGYSAEGVLNLGLGTDELEGLAQGVPALLRRLMVGYTESGRAEVIAAIDRLAPYQFE